MMPGRISGSVTVAITRVRLAPRVRAAASRRGSTASMDRRMARTMSGKPITAEATAAPFQSKARVMPKTSCSQAPTTPWRPRATSSR